MFNFLKLAELFRSKRFVDDDFLSIRDKFDAELDRLLKKQAKIVCLCGSTRFKEQYERANKEFTLRGFIVLSVGCFGHYCLNCGHLKDSHSIAGYCYKNDCKCEQFSELSEEQKIKLDELHMRKIELADEVHFLNVGGYMGNSTKRELAYAKMLGKEISFLDNSAHMNIKVGNENI